MKGGATILVVEDNDITRKMARVALEAAGYRVLEAADARAALALTQGGFPDIILQDLILPDMDGFDLVRRLRERPGGGEIPILAFSGFVSKVEEARASAVGFTDFLVKPVEPSRLVETVEAYLAAPGPQASRQQRHVLVADDDPVQLKLLRIRLAQKGFRVTAAADGQEALEFARRILPDAVVSDVLMPRLDGFKLALAIRKDPRLAHVPVILTSSSYIEEMDRQLARKVGANAFVLRTPDCQETIQALTRGLEATEAIAPTGEEEPFEAEYAHRVIRQLERQARMNANLSQRCALQAAELSILLAVSEALTGSSPIEKALDECLARCLDATGISLGALCLLRPDGKLYRAATGGYPLAAAEELDVLLERHGLFTLAIQKGSVLAVPSDAVAPHVSKRLFDRIQAASALIIPLVPHGVTVGALMLASRDRNLREPDWLRFSQTIAAQIGQGVALTRAFSQVAASEERYRNLMEHAGDAILTLNTDLHVMQANRRAEAMLGLRASEIVGRPCRDLIGVAAEAGGVRALDEAIRAGETRLHGARVRGPRGRRSQVDISVTRVEIEAEPFLLLIARDVTERNQLELQLRQAQKMEAVGRLAGGVAHDFNNLLTTILGLSELSMKELPQGHQVRRDLEEIKETATRAAQLTQQLLAFSRKQIVQPQFLDLNRLIAGSAKLLRRIIGEDIELGISAAPDLWTIRADPGQIEQVVVNLCVNSRDAMPKGGNLSIKTANAVVDEQAARANPGMLPGQYSVVSVADDGTGLTEEAKAHLFEPFFTTKEHGKGTGLGLATCYGIIKQSGGYIAVDAASGRGTTFKVYLPRVEAEAEPVARPPRLGEVPRGAETILIVEDEVAVRNLAARVLRKLGYVVLEAGDGQEALELVEGDSQKNIRLLLTDVVMPRLGGKPVADEVMSRRPDMKIVFTSGYMDEIITHQGVLDAGINFLGKPFTPEDLARKIRAVLDSKSS